MFPKRAFSVIAMTLRRASRHGQIHGAAALTYYLLFSAFPFIILTGLLLSHLGIEITLTLSTVPVVPGHVSGFFDGYLSQMSEKSWEPYVLFTVVFITFVSMYRAMICLREAIDRSFEALPEKKDVNYRLEVFAMAAALLASIIASLVVLGASDSLIGAMFKSVLAPVVWEKLKFVLLTAFIFVTLSLIYYFLPTKRLRYSQILPGTVVSVAGWLISSLIFGYYAENIASYTTLYGSVATVMVVILWIHLVAIALIYGAEFNSSLMKIKEQGDKK